MAVSVANYQSEQNVPKLNSLGYDDESVSLAKCLPSHPQKPSRLPIFETAVIQQNGVGNSQRNAPQGHVRSNANMGSHHHSMNCGDFSSNMQQQPPSQNRNGCKQSFSQSRSEKIRKRASSFNENLGKNKPLQSSQSLNSQKVDKQTISFQQGEKSSSCSKSPKSIQGSEQSPIQSQKPSQHIKLSTPTNQRLELDSPKSHDQKHSNENSQSTNDDIKSNIATSTDSAVVSKSQNSAGQQSSNQLSFNHTNDLRKSFTKRLKRVFSLSNIKQDDVTQLSSSTSNSSSPSPPSASVVKPKFSSLR
ncbi:712_t:CDS:2, partial [Dentiscutata heterogama]